MVQKTAILMLFYCSIIHCNGISLLLSTTYLLCTVHSTVRCFVTKNTIKKNERNEDNMNTNCMTINFQSFKYKTHVIIFKIYS